MFLVRSMRTTGAMVEVVQRGSRVNIPINGMGITTSDGVTDDMITQQSFGFIKYWNKIAEKRVPKVELITDRPNTDTPLKLPEMYREVELLDMTRRELRDLCESRGIELERGLRKDILIGYLLAAKVAKEK